MHVLFRLLPSNVRNARSSSCPICAQVKGKHRQVHKNPAPAYDSVPGRTIYMDSIYWDCESRNGNWYTAAAGDDYSS
jgi:hypothetical protein